MKQWFLKTRNDPISGETCLKHRHCKSHHFGSGVLGRFLLSLRDRIIWTVPPELVPMPRLDTWWAWRSSEQTGDRTNCFDILEFFSIASALDQTSSAGTFRNSSLHALRHTLYGSTEESHLSSGFGVRSFTQGSKTPSGAKTKTTPVA